MPLGSCVWHASEHDSVVYTELAVQDFVYVYQIMLQQFMFLCWQI